jgi:hypothetical protein
MSVVVVVVGFHSPHCHADLVETRNQEADVALNNPNTQSHSASHGEIDIYPQVLNPRHALYEHKSGIYAWDLNHVTEFNTLELL